MRLERFLVRIHIAPGRVVHAQGLNRADHHNRAGNKILRTQLLAFGDVDHRQPVRWKIFQQRITIRMPRGF